MKASDRGDESQRKCDPVRIPPAGNFQVNFTGDNDSSAVPMDDTSNPVHSLKHAPSADIDSYHTTNTDGDTDRKCLRDDSSSSNEDMSAESVDGGERNFKSAMELLDILPTADSSKVLPEVRKGRNCNVLTIHVTCHGEHKG